MRQKPQQQPQERRRRQCDVCGQFYSETCFPVQPSGLAVCNRCQRFSANEQERRYFQRLADNTP